MSQRDGPNDTNAHRDATTQADNAAPNHRGAYQKDRGVLQDYYVWIHRIYVSCTLGTEFNDLFCLFTNQTTQNSNPLADALLADGHKAQTQGIGLAILGRIKGGAGHKSHMLINGLEQQLLGINALGQRHPNKHPALGACPDSLFWEMLVICIHHVMTCLLIKLTV